MNVIAITTVVQALTFEKQVQAAVATAKAIDAANAAMGRELHKVRSQLADALDAVQELKSQIVTKDNMIAELQELCARGNR